MPRLRRRAVTALAVIAIGTLLFAWSAMKPTQPATAVSPAGGTVVGNPSNPNVKTLHVVAAPPGWADPAAPSGMQPGDTVVVPPKYSIPTEP